MNHMTHPLSFDYISICSPKISKFCYVKKYRYRMYFALWFLILLNFFESLKIVLTNMVTILMTPAKLATLDLLKIKLCGSKGYGVVIPIFDVANKSL